VTEAELKMHLDAAEKSPKEIAAAVLGLPEKTLRFKPSPEKWCIWEILGHMADMEILYAYRIRQRCGAAAQRGSEDCTTTEVSRRPHRSQRGSAGGSVNFYSSYYCPTLTSK
jgi:hypothetical protein